MPCKGTWCRTEVVRSNGVVSCLLIIWIGLSACLSPLNRIPSAHHSIPFIAFWVFWNRLQDREIHTVAEAFRKKGPIVRRGPNEIAVNVIKGGIKTVHNGDSTSLGGMTISLIVG